MPVQEAIEAWGSGKIVSSPDNPSLGREYIIFGHDDYTDALLELISVLPATDSIPQVSETAYLQSASIAQRLGPAAWRGQATWGLKKPPSTDEPEIKVRTSGGSGHLDVAYAQRAYPPWQPGAGTEERGRGALDHYKLINATKDALKGLDIKTPVFEWTETWYFPVSVVASLSWWKARIYPVTAKMNQEGFRSFEPGEVLFLGAEGTAKARGKYAGVSFGFAASPNVENLTIGDINGILKKGWEYLEVLSDEVLDSTAQITVRKPVAVYVSQVYKEAIFTLLGIGN